MHRVDTDGNVSGQFSDGNPAVPTPATVVDASWLNDVQEEICKLIEGAGITLVKGTQTQLQQAVRNSLHTISVTTTDSYGVVGDARQSADSNAASVFGQGGGTAVGVRGDGGATTAGVLAQNANGGPGLYALSVGGGSSIAAKIERDPSSTRGALNIVPVAGDPAAPQNGDIWYNSTTNSLRCYVNGAIKTFTVA